VRERPQLRGEPVGERRRALLEIRDPAAAAERLVDGGRDYRGSALIAAGRYPVAARRRDGRFAT
jgi:hypothetical protein